MLINVLISIINIQLTKCISYKQKNEIKPDEMELVTMKVNVAQQLYNNRLNNETWKSWTIYLKKWSYPGKK